MSLTQTATAKVFTELTCWKCGEEALKEMVEAVDPNAYGARKAVTTALMRSECTKCGTLSVNATQSRQNKTIGRKTRKAIIKESNRMSG